MDFAKYKKAQKHVYSDDSDVNPDQKDGRFIKHEGDFVLKVQKIKHGISENKKNPKSYKKPYIVVEASVEKINWQEDHKPQTDNEIEAGKNPIPAKPVREDEMIVIHNRLPRETDPELMNVPEQYQVADVCALFGSLLGMDGDAFDMADLNDLLVSDGDPLKGALVGASYERSLKKHKDSDDNYTGEQSVYVNERPYPVDSETLERVEPKTAEEVAALLAEAEE